MALPLGFGCAERPSSSLLLPGGVMHRTMTIFVRVAAMNSAWLSLLWSSCGQLRNRHAGRKQQAKNVEASRFRTFVPNLMFGSTYPTSVGRRMKGKKDKALPKLRCSSCSLRNCALAFQSGENDAFDVLLACFDDCRTVREVGCLGREIGVGNACLVQIRAAALNESSGLSVRLTQA